MARFKLVNGQIVQLTPEEEITRAAEEADGAQELVDLTDGTTAENNATVAWDGDLEGYILTIKDVKALALLMLDEINILRALHGETARTPDQMKTAFIAKRKTLL